MNTNAAEVAQIMSLPTCTVDEAAKVLRIGRTQACTAVRTGEIRSITFASVYSSPPTRSERS